MGVALTRIQEITGKDRAAGSKAHLSAVTRGRKGKTVNSELQPDI
jgi:hypothetical protein